MWGGVKLNMLSAASLGVREGCFPHFSEQKQQGRKQLMKILHTLASKQERYSSWEEILQKKKRVVNSFF